MLRINYFLLILIILLFFKSAFLQDTAQWNGVNIPWNQFGYDIGANALNQTWFQIFFSQAQENHINAARFWLHCDGRASPLFNPDGSVSGLSSTFLSDLQTLVSMAKQYDIVLLISIWSFDMCQNYRSVSPTGGMHADMITNQTRTEMYINNALIPILQSLTSATNVVYEIMNEPEWTTCTTAQIVSLDNIQRFHGMLAAAIHKNSPQKVTTGSASLKWDSAKVPPAVGNWWNDSQIQAQFDDPDAHLDFYQVHYYDWMYNPSWGYDPNQLGKTTSFWLLDKPTIVGELPATGGSYYTPYQTLNNSYTNGFVGELFWAYNSDWPWTTALPALNQFYSEHEAIANFQALVNWLQNQN